MCHHCFERPHIRLRNHQRESPGAPGEDRAQDLVFGVSLGRRAGFTVVELLVVVTIIAILISMLLPSLGKARRSAKVVICATQLNQIGVGLTMYSLDYNSEYPPPTSHSLGHVHGPSSPGAGVDNREAFVQILGGQTQDAYFCPLYRFLRPELSPTQTQYSKYFYVDDTGGANYHVIGYAMYFQLFDDGGASFDWSNTDTPQGPYKPRDSKAVIASDLSSAVSATDAPAPDWSAHNELGMSFPSPFIDSNSLYGDVHVETHSKELKQWVIRWGSPYWPW